MQARWRGVLVIVAVFLFGVYMGAVVSTSALGTLCLASAGACLVAAVVLPGNQRERR